MLEQRILEELFRQNYSKMIHLARVLLGDDEEAEDVVQDIFLRLANSDIAFHFDEQPSGSPKSSNYLLTAVRNACLNKIRQKKLHERVKAFHFRFDEDLTIRETARRLGLNPNTTYKYLMQSIQQIKNHFSKL